MKPQIISVPVSQLVKADWNYKTDGTPEQIEKLAASVAHDQSAGVPAVRRLSKGKYEVIDGNHRLDVIKALNWEKVDVEDFGTISTAEAVTISRRRNYQWFQDDILRLSTLFRDVVFPEIPLEDLVKFMPDTSETLEALSRLSADFDWTNGGKIGTGDYPLMMNDNLVQFRVLVTGTVARQLDKVGEEVKSLSENPAEAKGQIIAHLLKKVVKKGRSK